jgi:MFS family permease
MREKIYVDRLFADFENTPELQDFKEEITGNLKERIKEFIMKGHDEEKAFEQATAELGDITAIADDVGKKKRNETIGQMYIGMKVPLTKRTAAGITVASGLLLFAVGLLLITFFGNKDNALVSYISAAALAVACGLYTYFGLTQETAAHYPMKNGRALAYGMVCLMGVLGAALAVVSFVLNGWGMSDALIVKIALILPAICGLIFLLATESKRQKPWLKAMIESHSMDHSVDFSKYRDIVSPVKAAKFGVTSGGLWLLAIAVFVALGFVIGWQYSWLTFLFAAAIQVFMIATIFEKKREPTKSSRET